MVASVGVAAAAQAPAPLVPGDGLKLFQGLATAAMDPQRIFKIRDCNLDLEDLHITLEDGTIAYTQAVDGRITGAFFTGEGTVLVLPPDQVERASLALFTQSAALNEHFTQLYLRWDGESLRQQLESAHRGPAPDGNEIVSKWGPLVKDLARADALRLTVATLNGASSVKTEFLHARIAGERLGNFDAFYDKNYPEAITVAQAGYDAGRVYDNVWLSFSAKSQRAGQRYSSGRDELVTQTDQAAPNENGVTATVAIKRFDIDAELAPPTDIRVGAQLHLTTNEDELRAIAFELSHNLKVSEASLDGKPVEVLQNPAVPGSEVARTGNDVLAVILPQPLEPKTEHTLSFRYAGPVMTDRGGGLLYVGDRGTWYPNLGLRNSEFDLRFRFPAEYKLEATGAQVESSRNGASAVMHFRSQKPIPVAGFNLGQFFEQQAKSPTGSADIHVFAAKVMENHPTTDPSANLASVAQQSAQTVGFYESHLVPFPYHELAITQLPGEVSQGWPGLIYLATPAFLSASQVQFSSPFLQIVFQHLMLSHELGHQYWGQNVSWRSYREQWIMEALANYSALLFIDGSDRGTVGHRSIDTVMDQYRQDLLAVNEAGIQQLKAGPVTLGSRLDSSKFPNGYNAITYGRGTWLIHMLRSMMRDAAQLHAASGEKADPDAQFWQALRSLQTDFAAKAMSEHDLQAAFEKVWPRSIRYENSASLDWFFHDWVNGVSMPTFELQGVKITASGTATGTIATKDTPKDFTALLPLYAEMADGSQRLVAQVFADEPEAVFKIEVPAGTKRLLLDPKNEVLRRV